jgi:hypothetical protein
VGRVTPRRCVSVTTTPSGPGATETTENWVNSSVHVPVDRFEYV